MMKFNRHIRTYIWIALLAYMSIAALIAVNYYVLYQTGELDGLDKIVKAQQQTSGLYNGLSEGMAAYKYEGYRQRRPEIVAIGTSRAMQIRDYFFTKPFYNLGGLVQGQTQAFALLDQLILKHPPQTIIFAVDFWTFCTQKKEFLPFIRPTGTFHDGQGNPSDPLLLIRLLAEGRLSSESLKQIATHLFNPLQRALPRTGISALLTDSGFGPDGSMYNLISTKSTDASSDIKVRSQIYIKALNRGDENFISPNCTVSNESLSYLTMLGTELANQGINLIVIAPPITSALLKAVKKSPAANTYMSQWRQRLKEAWPQTYDFTDPRSIGSSDCEFYDGIHGGEVAYARIFRALAKSGPKRLKQVLNVKNLDQVIAIGKNKITVALRFPETVRAIELGGFKTCNPNQY